MKKIKVGIIGLGNIGLKRYTELKKLKNVKIILICDKKKIQIQKSLIFLQNWRKIINYECDLVIISVPTKVSEKIAYSLSGKFNLLVEKPLSENISLVKKIISRSIKSKKIFKVGYNLRFDEGIQKAESIYRSGKIGKIYYSKITYANGASRTNTNKVGSLLDMGSHALNLFNFFFKTINIKKISKIDQKNEFLNKTKIDNSFTIFKIKKINCFLHHGFCTWKNQFEFDIYGSKGFLKVLSLPKWGKQEVIYGRRTFPSGVPVIKKWIFNEDKSWANELNYVIGEIRKKTKNIRNNYEALQTLAMINQIKKLKCTI
jgi:predicted dehydrogenase